jgi:hypothetical protein
LGCARSSCGKLDFGLARWFPRPTAKSVGSRGGDSCRDGGGLLVIGHFDAPAFHEAAEPSELPPRETACSHFCPKHGFRQIKLTREVGRDLAVADRLRSGASQAPAAGSESAYFVNQSVGKHCIDARFDPPVQLRAWSVDDEHATLRGWRGGGELMLGGADRNAGRPVDFQGANDSAHVARVKPCRRDGIDFRQSPVQCRCA